MDIDMAQPTAEGLAQDVFVCIVDGLHGVYSGQVLAQRITDGIDHNIDADNLAVLECGPDDTDYSDVLESIMLNYRAVDDSGDVWHLCYIDTNIMMYNASTIQRWELQTGRDFWDDYKIN